jgi:hypothetical protein
MEARMSARVNGYRTEYWEQIADLLRFDPSRAGFGVPGFESGGLLLPGAPRTALITGY